MNRNKCMNILALEKYTNRKKRTCINSQILFTYPSKDVVRVHKLSKKEIIA